MPTLDDLSPYRRAKLLWRWAHQGLHFVEQLVADGASHPCHLPTAPPGPPGTALAVPGDDGRHHLVRAGRMMCGETETATDGGWPHRQYCSWTETDDGPQEWTGGRDGGDITWGDSHTEWAVRPAGEGVDPGTVPRRERCVAGRYTTMHSWPPPPARTASIRRLRAALVNTLGPDCHLCGHYAGAMVDHDHESGLVRGLLCAMCNRTVEECPHVRGCPKADYQNTPPAAGLGLLYPAGEQWRPKESTRRNKIEMLGFDPFEGLPVRYS
ncbi:endonuclease domain-containing protein [Streptomyces scabiei]|uniref:endonuclease domain-containing protein n=1 Tax=Streptomyces scabiei TaxID=1930 RepID=UPI0029B29DEF|nr:endonuclease domain-containing protein [Streptomyces scabiei]MDX3165896.1 endonuclease domain-containing protein [Streptomyces scabiei]